MSVKLLPDDFNAVDLRKFGLYVEGIRCAVSSISLGYGIDAVPSLRFTCPATDYLDVIYDRTKVHLRYLDTITEGTTPYLRVLFEGEVRQIGFSKNSNGSRSYIFGANHISGILEASTIEILSVNEYTDAVLSGFSDFGITVTGTSPNPSGNSIWDQFRPTALQSAVFDPAHLSFASGNLEDSVNAVIGRIKDIKKNRDKTVSIADLDIYDFVLGIFIRILSFIDGSLIDEAYDYNALRVYDMVNRMHYPATGSNLNWKEFFTTICDAYITNMLERVSGEQNFLTIARKLMGMFLHEFMINPMPRSKSQTMLPKPNAVFLPIPSCNAIYSIFTPSYEFSDNFQSKPTRLIQYADPAWFSGTPGLTKYFLTESPAELEGLFAKWNGKSGVTEIVPNSSGTAKEDLAEKIKKLTDEVYPGRKDIRFNLVTEEERQRGIVKSFNNVPPYITMTLRTLLKKDTNVTEGESQTPVGSAPKPKSIVKGNNKSSRTQDTLISSIRYHTFNQKLIELTKASDKGLNIKSNGTFYPEGIIFIKDVEEYPTHYHIGADNSLKQPQPRYYGIHQDLHFLGKGKTLPYKLFTDNSRTSGKYFSGNVFTFGIGKLLGDPALIFSGKDISEIIGKAVDTILVGSVFANITGTSLIVVGINTPQAKVIDTAQNRLIAKLVAYLFGLTRSDETYDPNFVKTIKESYGTESGALFKDLIVKIPDDLWEKEISAEFNKVLKEIKTQEERAKKFNTYHNLGSSVSTSSAAITASSASGPQVPQLFDPGGEVSDDPFETTGVLNAYLKPLSHFYFYYSRHSANNQLIPMVFNPYIMPGFNAVLIDNPGTKSPRHLLGYVSSVSHTITPASANTTVSLQCARLLNDVPRDRNSKLVYTDPTALVGDKSQNTSQSIYEVMQEIPFFAGEYSTIKENGVAPIEETFKEIMGKNTFLLKMEDLSKEPENIHNAYRAVSRDIQICTIGEIVSKKGSKPTIRHLTEILEKTKDKSVNAILTVIKSKGAVVKGTSIENGKLASDIIALYNTVTSDSLYKLPDEIASVSSPGMFNPVIRDGVRAHTRACMDHEGLVGTSVME